MTTIQNILESQSLQQPYHSAIIDIEGKSSSYRQLLQQAQYTQAALNARGIERNDPVAVILPNGPLMAVAFLSVASCAASAPLNPAFPAAEFKFFLEDLKPKAVIIESGSTNVVKDVAHRLSIPVIHLEPKEDNGSGLFSIAGYSEQIHSKPINVSKPSDVALILHTSGTTARPKMVPLTQKNLCTSAENIRQTLNLTTKDRCLNIMPLFHIHGLIAALLATVKAGGSLVCTPGFYAPRFFEWFNHFQPTWYTAVPTMHQAILNRAHENPGLVQNSSLRFVRSSSASLPPIIMKSIEAIFGVPVIEAYGMTEAAHQMASNPLPPGIRKPGSVGLSAGPEIAIMHEDGPTLLSQNQTGEVVIRGDNVTLGYLNNREANQASFVDGWFRTGDQGYLDSNGYLFLTGRLKELINRGGEKISPREVDEVLLNHPGVKQAVTFSVLDEVLGEDILAAVVVEDQTTTEIDLKRFAAASLAPHKVPSRIFLLDELPKGPTGKLQRIGLAEKLGLSGVVSATELKAPYKPPRNDIETRICEIWENILDKKQIGISQQFREVGGDSMLATLIHQELENLFGIQLALIDVYAAGTIESQAHLVTKTLANR